jgi:Predicted nucleic acid-binding protein, contains PIN domain
VSASTSEAKVLVDTNAASALMRGSSAIIAALADVEEFLIPCIVAGELYYGAYHAPLSSRQISRVSTFIADNRTI